MKRASDNLVRAAQKAAFGKADDDDVVVKTKFVGGIAQVSGQTHSRVHLPRQGSYSSGRSTKQGLEQDASPSLLNVTGCKP